MPSLSTYKIVGFDPDRPPKIESFPCIYLNFALDEQAPPGWCEQLILTIGKSQYPVKMHAETGLFVETWVRKPDEINAVLENLKVSVEQCNEAYDKKVNAPIAAVNDTDKAVKMSPAQLHLNQIVSELSFD